MKDQYVVLTGAKNNAGDYLIKHRTKQLFSTLRPDRNIVDFNNWEPFTEQQLIEVNSSRGLILAGGPALQPKMYPTMFPLVEDLNKIEVPILTMAIGWKGRTGDWAETCRYPLSEQSLLLLNRINESGFTSSVRDYHTLSVLNNLGFNQFSVTGCSALFSQDHIGFEIQKKPVKAISMSMGVSFFHSIKRDEVNKRLILTIRDQFPEAEFTILFHHSTDSRIYQKTHNPNLPLLKAQLGLIAWLEEEKILWKDISGKSEMMLDHYAQCDFHIGYRMHAHILMASQAKPTILIAEDGRGMALKEVLGGAILDATSRQISSFPVKLISRIFPADNSLMASNSMASFLSQLIAYEIDNNYPRIRQQQQGIASHFELMKKFVSQLP